MKLTTYYFIALVAAQAFLPWCVNATVPLELYYTSAAEYASLRTSQEALPVGNGKLAAMVYGGVGTEHIQFNEDTVWAGAPNDYSHAGASGWLQAIRDFVWEGEGEKAWTDAARDNFMSIPIRQSPYVGTGILRFETGHGGASNYRRSLDLDTATAVIEYAVGGVTYRREVFASYPDQVIVMRFTASEAGRITFTATYDSPHTDRTASVSGGDFILSGKVNKDANTRRQQTSAIEFQARARFDVAGGTTSDTGSAYTVTGADSVTVVMSVATNFIRFDDVSGDPEARTLAVLAAVAGKDYTALREAHLADYQQLFNRVELDLGTTAAASLPTDQRLIRLKDQLDVTAVKDAQKAQDIGTFTDAFAFDDPHLVALNFQLARYLLIASSRPGSQPMTLQGKWNNELDPSWESKMTLNINQEMNYWLAEIAALPETHLPMVDLVKDLSISGAQVASVHYDARGWMVHHNTDLWRGAAPINNPGGLWPTGNAWLSMHLWWHFEYGRDPDYLEEIYPLLKGAVQFHEDFLVMDPRTPADLYPAWGNVGHPQWGQYLLTNPSHSPEQANKLLRDDGEIIAGPTIDNQLLRALFSYFIEASETLDRDADLRASAAAMRDLLPPNMIGKHGQLQEWLEDVDVPENPAIGGHRHLSHMIDLFPGEGIHPVYEPELTAAVKVALDWKGDLSNNTSWGRAWKMNLRAAMLAGDHAFMVLSDVIGRSHTANMVFSNKGNGEDQIDGNMGVAMGTAQFFLQSRRGEIHLLPAVPTKLARGSLKGFRAKGGFTVDLAWEDRALTSGTIHSRLGGTCRVRSETPLSVWHDGDAVALTTVDEDLYEFATAPGAAYLLMPAGSAPPPVAPARVGVGFTGETGITLSFQSVDGLQYELHKSVDGMGSWQPSGDPVVSASGGLMELQDENGKPAEGESVFYRVTVTN
jgi:alpha-L-fucosidase 2